MGAFNSKKRKGILRKFRSTPNQLFNLVKQIESLNDKAHLFPNPLKPEETLKFSLVVLSGNSKLVSKDIEDRKEDSKSMPPKCPAAHEMKLTKGIPPAYNGKHSWVYCDDCKQKGIHRHPDGYWHCSICRYDKCISCQPKSVARILIEVVTSKNTQNVKSLPDRQVRLLTLEQFASLEKEILQGCSVLSTSLVAKIKKEALSRKENDGESADIDEKSELCEICYEKPVTVMLGCTHTFCDECLEKWTAKQFTCPMCRAPIADHDSHEKRRSSVGWVLASQDKEMLQIGKEALRNTWTMMKSFPSPPSGWENQIEDELFSTASKNIDRVSRRMSMSQLSRNNSRVVCALA